MNTKFFVAVMVMCTSTLFAQATNQPTDSKPPVVAPAEPVKTQEISVKPSPAEDTLVQMASQMEATKSAFDVILQQAQINLDAKNKPIIDQMKLRTKKYQDMADAATKDLRKEIDKNQAAAADQFNKDVAALGGKAVSPQTISTLEELVRKEQNLPETAHYDTRQKKWLDIQK